MYMNMSKWVLELDLESDIVGEEEMIVLSVVCTHNKNPTQESTFPKRRKHNNEKQKWKTVKKL